MVGVAGWYGARLVGELIDLRQARIRRLAELHRREPTDQLGGFCAPVEAMYDFATTTFTLELLGPVTAPHDEPGAIVPFERPGT